MRTQQGNLLFAGLPVNAKRLVRVLSKKAGSNPECWCSNETIANALECTTRTVRNCLRLLRLRGLIEVVADYSLNSRRRILLLFRKSPSENASVEEKISPTLSSTNESPPIKRSEESSKEDDDSPPPSIATAEDTKIAAEVITKAEAIAGETPKVRAWFGAAAKRFGWATLRHAIDQAAKKLTREPIQDLYAYVWSTSAKVHAAGGPPAPTAVPAKPPVPYRNSNRLNFSSRVAATGGSN